MRKRFQFAVLTLLAAAIGWLFNHLTDSSRADQAAQRLVFGNSLCLTGLTVDACSPTYSPPAGSYSVKWTGSAGPRPTDDFTILLCGAQNNTTVTYTMPQSTSTVFPPGHQVIFKNDSTSQTAPGICTITATTSTICGASGVVSGNPAAPCGPITLFPGGEVTLIATTGNNYWAMGYLPGVWNQFANNATSLVWTFPAYGSGGYAAYKLRCFGVIPATSNAHLRLQVAYGGTFQVSGYSYQIFGFSASTSGVHGSTSDTSIDLPDNITNNGPGTGDGETVDLLITETYGTGAYYRMDILGLATLRGNTENWSYNIAGQGPSSASANLTGVQLFMSSGNMTSAMCSLRPNL